MDIKQKFQLWYKEPIETLIAKDEHTGFAVLMITLPILERYVRRKLSITSDNLTMQTGFFDELATLFPQFRSPKYAQRFWKCYRHGLLHQATLQLKDGVAIAFVHGSVPILECSPDGREFRLSPNKFGRAVLSIVENDLETFEDSTGPPPQLPTISISSLSSGVFRP